MEMNIEEEEKSLLGFIKPKIPMMHKSRSNNRPNMQ